MNRKQRRAAETIARQTANKPPDVRTKDGKPFDLTKAIFPIFSERTPGEHVVEGTGFYVTRFGHFLTAYHVVKEPFEKEIPLFMFHTLDDGERVIQRGVCSFSHHRIGDVVMDVALGTLEHPVSGYVFNCVPTLTRKCPEIGKLIITAAYDKRTRLINGEYNIQPHYSRGVLKEVLPRGYMLPSPCYRSSMKIPGGASGGPVFDSQGRAFAINSTDFAGQPDISFLSRIEEALPLIAAGIKLGPDDQPRDRTLRQLGESGHVQFEPSLYGW